MYIIQNFNHFNSFDFVILDCITFITSLDYKFRVPVFNFFNNFFSNVANDIGKNLEGVTDFQNHPTIKHITSSMSTVSDTGGFAFENVDFVTVSKLIDKLDCKKYTGVDGISAKMLKAGSKSLCFPLTNLINVCMAESHFPANLK
jgi:hypothetical protein